MHKVLILDGVNKLPSNIDSFDKVICINEEMKGEIDQKKIIDLDLHHFFLSSHGLSRVVNNKLLELYDLDKPLHFSLLKLSDKAIYEAVRLIQVSKYMRRGGNQVLIMTNRGKIILFLMRLLDLNDDGIVFKKWGVSKKRSRYRILKVISYLMDYYKEKKYEGENIFVIYNDKVSFEYAKPYLNDVIIYPFFIKGRRIKPLNYSCDKYLGYRMISPKKLIYMMWRYYKNRKEINKKIDCEEIRLLYLDFLFPLEIEAALFLTLKEKMPNLKTILGAFDAYSPIDYVTNSLNKICAVKTICIPHGVNFKEKVNYISLGVNLYTFWSKNHLTRMRQSNIIEKDFNGIVTGSSLYKNIIKHKIKKESKSKKILVIGEYFSDDNLYSSPFNPKTSKEFFDVISLFVKENEDCYVTIRTRVNDGYYDLALQYVNSRIVISTPEKSIINEINDNDLIISVFSNALHEGLLLEKDILQVNLLGIENYRDLASDGLVYYASNKLDFYNILCDWYSLNLNEIDYKRHLKKYANDGDFERVSL